MKLLISDLDGTLTNNKHRVHLKNNPDAYFRSSARDPINKIGYDLYKSIDADYRCVLSVRPVSWRCSDDTLLDLWYIALHWLKYYNIPITDLLLRNPSVPYEKAQKDKLDRLQMLIDIHKDDEVIYLENREDIALAVKDRFPNICVNLVSYSGARRL